jgi:coatomer subunit beta
LWIIGEYAESINEVTQAFTTVKRNVGSLPIFPVCTNEVEEIEKTQEKTTQPTVKTKTIILPDGSYGTQTIVIDDAKSKTSMAN